ncbi:hypothetical protein DH2020_016170 [Rehmannia glutinosa]|uniref:No apical meristem-associated C-terminal domain-containing protein n=1 Tax=Rehmannia glutinosa TaxID=99300 RepID=A0ABR0WUQ9_REHGL
MASSRNSSYTLDEDRHLCHVYVDISQDSEIRVYQKREQFWNRVTEAYNANKPNSSVPDRTLRSIESRMQTILSTISKFKGCVQQVEYSKPSGYSEQDIGMKKSKLKRKKDEDMSNVLNMIREENQKLRDLLESSATKKDRDIQVLMQNVVAQKQNAEAKKRLAEVTQWEGDNKILMIDLDTISDPNRREYFQK